MAGPAFLYRNQVVLAGIESVAGVDSGLVPSADAVLVEQDVSFAANFDYLQTNEVSGALDGQGGIVGGGGMSVTLPVLLKGASAASAAPEWGVLMRGCAMDETILTAAVAGTAATAGATTITLDNAVAGTAVDDEYIGMVIQVTVGTAAVQTRAIVDYVAATKVVTIAGPWDTQPTSASTYSIPKQIRYAPVTENQESVSLYHYQLNKDSSANAKRTRVLGAMGTFSLSISARQFGRINFQFRGQLAETPADVAAPSAALYDPTRPRPFIDAVATLGAAVVKFNSLSITYGAQVNQGDDPGATYGYDTSDITSRNITGTIDPNMVLASSRDAFADWLAGTTRAMSFIWGTTVGNRIAITIPAAKYTGHAMQNRNGYAAENLPFEAIGQDQGLYLTVF